ncbi:MAG: AAA family ATPase [Rhodospirillales bacterium]|jgi:DNA transposition AAA+ family ATPase|nr:AAA family ATPase [Rhodospirillales bacterium]
MNVIVSEEYTPERQEEVRAEVRRIMEVEGLSQADVARESGVKYGTFTGWLAGTYDGRNDLKAAEIDKWLRARREKAAVAAVLPEPPAFQATATAQEIVGVLQWCKTAQDFGVVVGVPGIGKTKTFEYFREVTPHVWMATLEPSVRGVHQVLTRLCHVMKIAERRPTMLSTAISDFVKGKGGLIIVDEAHQATIEALDQLRAFADPDVGGTGVVVGGNHALLSRLKSGGPANAQLTSRVGMRRVLNKPRPNDIAAIIAAWKVEDPEIVKYLGVIGRKPGALRCITKTMRLAVLQARGGDQPLSIDHVRRAWTQLSDSSEPSAE